MSESVQTSPIELLDLENVGRASRISFISCMDIALFNSTSGFHWFLLPGLLLVPCMEAEISAVHTCFQFKAAILISGLDAVIHYRSTV